MTILTDERLQALIDEWPIISLEKVHLIMGELLLARRVVEVARNLCCFQDGEDFSVDTVGHKELEYALDTYDNIRAYDKKIDTLRELD